MDGELINTRITYDDFYEEIKTNRNVEGMWKVSRDKNMILIEHDWQRGYHIDLHWHDWMEFLYIKRGIVRLTLQKDKEKQNYLLNSGDYILQDGEFRGKTG